MNSKEELLRRLEEDTRVLRDPLVDDAFKTIDRKDFVPEKLAEEAYEDYPLPIGRGQTISQPTTVAFMLEKLAVKPGHRVLDVGSGSGWTTALLAQMACPASDRRGEGKSGSVIGVERIPELVKQGQENLSKYDFAHAEIRQAKETLGVPERAPFDRILVSAAAGEEVPEELIKQLAPGGKMLVPVESDIVEVSKEKDGSVRKHAHHGFAFVPLVE